MSASHDLPGPDRRNTVIAIVAVVGIATSLILRFIPVEGSSLGLPVSALPLLAVLLIGGSPLVLGLALKLFRGQFGSDLLAGLSIIVSIFLGEYLAGSIVVLMLSGGEALEAFAVRRASSALEALARRMPNIAHRKTPTGMEVVPLADIRIGDLLLVLPHEICPVDGTITAGHGTMDESYLTGEPFLIPKAPGSTALSGAINGESALTIHADKLPTDSRYAKIMEVMRESEQHRPQMRRLGDQLGAFYTPVAVAIAALAWLISGESTRFLAVLVVATPCPLLIAIPVAVIGAVSLAARRAIIIKDPSILERITSCKVAIFDKTGTLTYGTPTVTEVLVAPEFPREQVIGLVASLERYSKHPLAHAIVHAASSQGIPTDDVQDLSEKPGQGLMGRVGGHKVLVSGRIKLLNRYPELSLVLPPEGLGLECIALVDDKFAAIFRFRDAPRSDGKPFVDHLGKKHGFDRVMIISGDRDSEVNYLAEQVGVTEVYSGQTPEDKLAIVRKETLQARTVYVGDGINDAPAMTAATVGIAFGTASDVTAEAAGAVILDASLRKVDELLHIGRRMRGIALQSAVGGMALSIIGMVFASTGYLSPVAGAVFQEVIDVFAVLNALRIALPPDSLTDY